ncbi:hypothetical protein K458DRAFT_407126 [Lentithecium fluviatile CBS 122367]|uniref:Uncharacterized protein n=1 Tax=Lentithecium fluviatile CBS 122367 TaxID=1168545 RepID=A0A6G1IRS0_9PLEO|nr:hypothetical protein K458DRAFT_407126 [Lentithecium fluviatile CBS 122367]
MTVRPRDCAGDQSALIDVPCNAPNGTVAVQWQCAGNQATSGALLNITGGRGDIKRLQVEVLTKLPRVACLNSSSLLHAFPASDNARPSPVSLPVTEVAYFYGSKRNITLNA